MGWEKILGVWGMKVEFLMRIRMGIEGREFGLGLGWRRREWEALGFVVSFYFPFFSSSFISPSYFGGE